MSLPERPVVGRYAPSPTGDLHLGNVFAAVVTWARARAQHGRCLLRIEDLDTPRVIPGATARIVDDLAWLGLSFDGDVVVQSEHLPRYRAALAQLIDDGRVYGCACSRRELQRVASAPHAGDDGPPYRGTCRDMGLPLHDPSRPCSARVRLDRGVVVVHDAWAGVYAQDVAREVGDVIVQRKDGVFAYQLAVVVDDAWQGVTEVVRGRDLLSSAPRQVLLHRLLHPQRTPPSFAHLPLLVDERGERLSKRNGGGPTLLRTLRDDGWRADEVLGWLGSLLGVCDRGAHLCADELAPLLVDDVLRVPAIVCTPPAR